MSGFAPIDVSSNGGYAGGGGLLGFLAQGLQGYEQAHKAKLDESEQKEGIKEKKAESSESIKKDEASIAGSNLQNQVTQYALAKDQKSDMVSTAQSQFSNLSSMLRSHPEMLNDPSINKALETNANILGIPLVKDKKGMYDPNQFKSQHFTDLSPTDIDRLNQMDPAGRKRATANVDMTGAPDGFLTDPAVHPYKEETDRIRAGAQVTRAETGAAWEKHKERVDNTEVPLKDRLLAAKAGLLEATTSSQRDYMRAKISVLGAQAQKMMVEASAIPQRLGIEGQRLALSEQRLDFDYKKLSIDSSPLSMKNLSSSVRDFDSMETSMQSEIDRTKGTMVTYKDSQGSTFDPNDPLYSNMQNSLNIMNERLYKARTQAERARNMMSSMEGQAAGITRTSGKPTTILPRKTSGSSQPIGDAPEGAADGTTGKMPDGRRAVVRNGKLYAI